MIVSTWILSKTKSELERQNTIFVLLTRHFTLLYDLITQLCDRIGKMQIGELATDKEIIKVIQESLIAAAGSLMLSKPETNGGNYQDLTKPLTKI